MYSLFDGIFSLFGESAKLFDGLWRKLFFKLKSLFSRLFFWILFAFTFKPFFILYISFFFGVLIALLLSLRSIPEFIELNEVILSCPSFWLNSLFFFLVNILLVIVSFCKSLLVLFLLFSS